MWKKWFTKIKSPEKAPPEPDGIRSIRTTNVFQIINFELYVKPNLMVMAFGVCSITLSAAYLLYLRMNMDPKTYIAISEDGTQTLVQKKSKW
ncbi:small integral membrane protein 8-like isoform X2 [Hyalella azteca]|nr:small integral membrane protein 8-like isoform X2 [Hyalella azteca]